MKYFSALLPAVHFIRRRLPAPLPALMSATLVEKLLNFGLKTQLTDDNLAELHGHWLALHRQ